jgi:hypothetical protein
VMLVARLCDLNHRWAGSLATRTFPYLKPRFRPQV